MSEVRDVTTPEVRLNSIKGAATRLGIHWQTVRELIARGEIRPTVIGRRKLISEQELARFVAEHTDKGAQR